MEVKFQYLLRKTTNSEDFNITEYLENFLKVLTAKRLKNPVEKKMAQGLFGYTSLMPFNF